MLNNEFNYQYYWVTQQSMKIRNHIKGPPADSAADKTAFLSVAGSPAAHLLLMCLVIG